MATTAEESVSDKSATAEDKPVEKPDGENVAASLVGSGSTDYTLDANTNVDELATGILGLLAPAVEEVNERVNDVRFVPYVSIAYSWCRELIFMRFVNHVIMVEFIGRVKVNWEVKLIS